MNEEEYFDEIRRLKKRRVSEDQARQIINAEKKREYDADKHVMARPTPSVSPEQWDIIEAKRLRDVSIGEILEDKYVSVLDRDREDSPFGYGYTDFFEGMGESVVGIAKGLVKAIPAGFMGLIWPERGETRVESLTRNMNEAMLKESPDFPQTVAREAGHETVTFFPELLHKGMWAAGNIAEDVTGSKAVGSGVYTLPNLIPLSRLLGTAYKGMFPSATKFNPNAFKSIMGEIPDHFGIDVRARHGTFLSEALKVLSGMKDFSYYSDKSGGRVVALLQGIMEAAGSMLSLSNPYYQTISRETGFSPTVVRSLLFHYNKALTANKPETVKYHNNVIASEIRKDLGFRMKRGESIPASYLDAIKAFHPAMVEATGMMTPQMARELFDINVEDKFLAPLLEYSLGKGGKVNSSDQNIYTAGANPGQILSAQPRHIDVLTHPGSGLQVFGDTWSYILGGHRFNFDTPMTKKGSWKSSKDPLYKELPEASLTADYINKVHRVKKAARMRANGYVLYRDGKKVPLPMKKKQRGSGIDWLAYTEGGGQYKRDKSIKTYTANYDSKMPQVAELMIDGEPYFIFNTSKRTTDDLLGTLPGTILVNSSRGEIKVLSADELDLGRDWYRTALEWGFRKRFWTMFYGEHRFTDKQYNRAGIQSPDKKKSIPVKREGIEADPMAKARVLIEEVVKTKPDFLQWLTEKLIEPVSVTAGRLEDERKKRYENR